MAEVKFPEPENEGDTLDANTGIVYRWSPIEQTPALQKIMAYLILGSGTAVVVCAAIWLCATILAAVPSTAR